MRQQHPSCCLQTGAERDRPLPMVRGRASVLDVRVVTISPHVRAVHASRSAFMLTRQDSCSEVGRGHGCRRCADTTTNREPGLTDAVFGSRWFHVLERASALRVGRLVSRGRHYLRSFLGTSLLCSSLALRRATRYGWKYATTVATGMPSNLVAPEIRGPAAPADANGCVRGRGAQGIVPVAPSSPHERP